MFSETLPPEARIPDLPIEILVQIVGVLDFATRVELGRAKKRVSKQFEIILDMKKWWLPYFRQGRRSFVKKPRQILINALKPIPVKYIEKHIKNFNVDEYMEGITAIEPSTFLIHPDAQEARKKLQAIMDNKHFSSTEKQKKLRTAAFDSLASALLVITWPLPSSPCWQYHTRDDRKRDYIHLVSATFYYRSFNDALQKLSCCF